MHHFDFFSSQIFGAVLGWVFATTSHYFQYKIGNPKGAAGAVLNTMSPYIPQEVAKAESWVDKHLGKAAPVADVVVEAVGAAVSTAATSASPESPKPTPKKS